MLPRREQHGLMPLAPLLHPPRLALRLVRPNSHLKALSSSCWRRLASVRGRSLGWTLRRCADDFCEALPAGAAALSFRLLSDLLLPPLSERHVSVLVRKLPPLEDDGGLPAGEVDDVG